MKIRCAVLGSPIEHSLSPRIHRRAYEILGCDGEYSKFEVLADSLPTFLAEHPPMHWRGFSLTMPLKERAVALTKVVSEDVRAAGALNTLVAVDGDWLGFNTDVIAMRNLLLLHKLQRVSIFGAGGTSRAALVALSDRDCEIRVYRRSATRDADLLRIRGDINLFDWKEAAGGFDSDLVINTAPAEAISELGSSRVAPETVLDAIYSPWPPPLAELTGVRRYISGKELLVEQGIEQIRLFTGLEFKNEALRAQLRAAIE